MRRQLQLERVSATEESVTARIAENLRAEHAASSLSASAAAATRVADYLQAECVALIKVNEDGSLVCCEVGCITPHFGLSSKTRAPWARRGRGMWFGVGTARDRPSTSRVARR